MADQAYEPRLKTVYRERIRAAMKEQFGYTNEMQIPKLDKIVLNMVQRHTRPSQLDPQGGIKNKEASIHLSNVAVVDSKGKPTRVGFKIEGDKKVRIAKTTGEVING